MPATSKPQNQKPFAAVLRDENSRPACSSQNGRLFSCVDMPMKKLRWPQGKAEAACLRGYRQKHRKRYVAPEYWMRGYLDQTGLKWTHQKSWGYRIFDFCNMVIGCAIEVDGPEHDKEYDQYRDEYNFRRSSIIVIRARNYNDDDAAKTISIVECLGPWKERRALITSERRDAMVAESADHKYHPDYLEWVLRNPEKNSWMKSGTWPKCIQAIRAQKRRRGRKKRARRSVH